MPAGSSVPAADPDVAHLGLEDLRLGDDGAERPPWAGGLQNLWRSLEDLEDALAFATAEREEEMPDLRASWTPHLNRWHLFDHADAADRFRALSDEWVPEHAPFTVCGIFLAR